MFIIPIIQLFQCLRSDPHNSIKFQFNPEKRKHDVKPEEFG